MSPEEPADQVAPVVGDAGPRSLIIGTAGHIDHGKTSLIKALTGTDTDRLPEEKRRGLTIELGFAHLSVGPFQFGVVDVPGHERFVRTMVAGATGIDLALLVVAADDSVMPQTVEHVEILDLLGVDRGVVAVTKCDMVDQEMPELVAEEVEELLADTTLAGAAIVPVSSTTGMGLDGLREALIAAARDVEARNDSGPFRLAIDRVFTVQGRGTVVTGSVLQGRVSEGDALELWPGGQTCRVRALQSHNQPQEIVHGGQRAAVNLIGVDRDRIERGYELATPGYVRPTHLVDVRLRCLRAAPRPIKSRSRVRLCLGTRELMARVVTPTGQALSAGDEGYAQFRLSEPVTAVYGQRFIVRDETATRTVGGGLVLRASPKRRRIRGAGGQAALETLDRGGPDERVEEVLRFAGFKRPDALVIAAEAGLAAEEVPAVLDRLRQAKRLINVEVGGREGEEVVAATIKSLADRAVRWLERYHNAHADEPGIQVDAFVGYLDRKSKKGLGRPMLERMVKAKAVRLQGRYVCHPAYAPALSAQDERFLAAILDEYDRGGFRPPSLSELQVGKQINRQRVDRLIKIAVSTQQLAEVDGKSLFLHQAWADRLRERVAKVIRSGKEASVSEIRQELDSTRKYVVPFMEYLDRVGFTRREGDRRVLCETESS